MDYTSIFIRKEYQSLIGKKKKNLWICSALLFISVFTIALSLGAYQVLKERMDNPFTNWVTMPVLYPYRDSIPVLKQYFEKTENLSTFNLKNISGYSKWTFSVLNSKNSQIVDLKGRSMDFSDNLASKIFESVNIVSIKDSFSIDDEENLFMLFVSREFCDILGINPDKAPGKELLIKDFDDNSILIFKIGAVLKSLPNHSNFLISSYFFNAFYEGYEATGFIDAKDGTRISIISEKKLNTNDVTQVIGDLGIIDIETNVISVADGNNLLSTTLYFSGLVNDSIRARLLSKIKRYDKTALIQKEWNPVRGFPVLKLPMYLSFNFHNLDKIRDLQTFLKERYKLEIELSVVEERDNFSMVSKLTYFMILSLILVSLISFSIFLYNVINNHLEKIKPNIGTFMAFGFSARSIRNIYSISVIRFMLYSWLVAALFLLIFWLIGLFSGVYNLRLLHPIVLLTFFLFNILAYFLVRIITGKILFETPGDLIYGRV